MRILIRLGGIFHRVFGKFVAGFVVSLAMMRGSDAVRVRGQVMELGGSLVPVVAAYPAMTAAVASIAHKLLL